MKILKNYLYNTCFQIFVLIVPLITTPYISRVLGPKNVGINTLTYAYTQYFVLIATLGLTLFGQREIAYLRDDKLKMSKGFWEIEILSVITTVCSSILFLIFVIFIDRFRIYYCAQFFLILSCAVDISWLFMGLEKFKITVLRNFIIKTLSVILIFTTVRNSDDLIKYILIISVTTLLGNISLWPYIKKYIVRVPFKQLKIFRHLRGTIALFIPQIAISIYSVLNKIMLGQFSSLNQTGFFDSSDKIIRLSLTLVTAFTTVMMPHVANAFVSKQYEKIKEFLNIGLWFSVFMSLPILTFIIAISDEFVPWFFGQNFSPVSSVMKIEAVAIFPIACAGILGVQYLIPLNKNRLYTISILSGAVVNIIVNIPLISYFNAEGAALATVISEVCVTSLQFYFVRKNIMWRKLLMFLLKVLVASLFLFMTVTFESRYFSFSIFTFVVEGISGVCMYLLVAGLLNFNDLKDIFNKILKGKK